MVRRCSLGFLSLGFKCRGWLLGSFAVGLATDGREMLIHELWAISGSGTCLSSAVEF